MAPADEWRAETAEAASELRLRTAQLMALIETLQGGVLVEDADRRIVYVNESFCALFDIPVPPGALVGADCSQAAEQSKALFAAPELFVTRVGELLAARERVIGEVVRLADGRVYERDYLPLFIDGVHHGHVWHYRDVTERERAMAAANAAVWARDVFLANVSHELRTPLHGIIGMTELLLGGELNDEGRRFASAARDSALALNRIVGGLLELARLEAGEVVAEPEPVDVDEVVQSVVALLLPAAEYKGLRLSGRGPAGGGPKLMLDADHLRQILVHLTDNAVKFTERGAVLVSAGLSHAVPDCPRLIVEVQDTGVGMPAEQVEHLFEPFIQADSSASRRHGGLGLGLPIAQRLARAMGGTLEAMSLAGVGSTVRLVLDVCAQPAPSPVGACDPPVPARPPAPAPPATTALAARVLVVDDHPVNLEMLAALLTKLGCDVDTAGDGQTALARLAERGYDAVLMDCQMPGCDGYTATRLWREREPAGRRLPILALTANVGPGDSERCLAAGMDDYLTKPVTAQTLATHLQRWVGVGDVTAGVLPASALMANFAGCEDIFPSVVETYLHELPGQLEALRAALANGEGEALAVVAHSLKGASSSFNDPAVVELSQRLVEAGRAGELRSAQVVLADLERRVTALAAELDLLARSIPGH